MLAVPLRSSSVTGQLETKPNPTNNFLTIPETFAGFLQGTHLMVIYESDARIQIAVLPEQLVYLIFH